MVFLNIAQIKTLLDSLMVHDGADLMITKTLDLPAFKNIECSVYIADNYDALHEPDYFVNIRNRRYGETLKEGEFYIVVVE